MVNDDKKSNDATINAQDYEVASDSVEANVNNKSKQKVSLPKGRAYINWFGKQPLSTAQMYPCELISKTEGAKEIKQPYYKDLDTDWHNLMFHGDNKEILQTLITMGYRGKVDLIYIDPPFDSGADYVKKVELRGIKEKLSGEGQSFYEEVQYNDIWKQDSYLQFMYERLILLKELLSEKGSIYLHCDWHKSHHLRFLLDEVFGEDNFVNEIIWHYEKWTAAGKSFQSNHDNIFIYKKGNDSTFNEIKEITDNLKKKYEKGYLIGVGEGVRGLVVYDKDKLEVKEKINSGLYNVVYAKAEGKPLSDVWKIQFINPQATEREDYPTQKPEALLERIMKASSNKDSIVLDCFMGSGTTQAVAQKFGRKWIGIDCNRGAIQTSFKRLQKIAQNQDLLQDKPLKILQYKVNNYDFKDIKNMESIIYTKYGLQKTTHPFFEAKQEEIFVKIIDLNRPLTPLDISLIIKEVNKEASYEDKVLVIYSGISDEAKIQAQISVQNRDNINK